jgi:hypothetical protein
LLDRWLDTGKLWPAIPGEPCLHPLIEGKQRLNDIFEAFFRLTRQDKNTSGTTGP